MLVHALIDGTVVPLSVHGSGSSSSAGEQKHCGGKESQLHAVLLSSIPFGTAAVAALLVGHSSEKRQERRLHVGLPLLLGGCAFMLLPPMLQLHSHVPAFLMVTAAVVAADATTGPFWVSIPARQCETALHARLCRQVSAVIAMLYAAVACQLPCLRHEDSCCCLALYIARLWFFQHNVPK
jgi:drug/metabolite transporter (DMT)-like permease